MSECIQLTEDISIGDQPDADALRAMAEDGTRSVINLRTEDEVSPLSPAEEGATARALGLAYAHVPVSGESLGSEKLQEFSDALERLPKPTHVHCARGVRAGAFALIHLARSHGWSSEETMTRAERANVPLEDGAIREFLEHSLPKSGPA
jgi:uncharacterized protein (TIGR01244 family)